MRTLLQAILLSLMLASCQAQQNATDTRSALLDKLETMIRMRTVTQNTAELHRFFDWVEQEIEGLPLHVTRFDVNGYPSIVITTQKTKNPKVLLLAHADVVPGHDELFEPRLEGSKLNGRGTSDMKNSIACYLQVLRDLPGRLSDYDFGIMITGDEETGGTNGARYLAEQGYRAGVILDPDAGFGWKMEAEAKGVLHIKLTSKGVAGHGSRPWEGKNAISELSQSLADLDDHFDRKKDSDYYTTLNIGTFHGGEVTNQIPDHAEATIDIRFVREDNIAQLTAEIQKILIPYSDVDFEVLISAQPQKWDLTSDPYVLFRDIAREKHGIHIESVKSHGASDARFFGDLGIPVILVAPAGGDIHSESEWVDIDELVQYYDVMREWLIQLSSRAKAAPPSL